MSRAYTLAPLGVELRRDNDPYGYMHDLQRDFDYSKIALRSDEAEKSASADGGIVHIQIHMEMVRLLIVMVIVGYTSYFMRSMVVSNNEF